MSENPSIGIFGGTGLYQMSGLTNIEERKIKTPFGEPSSPVIIGMLEGKKLAFLARHGVSHQISPSEVNYKANIWAMKSLGVKWLMGISACGSLREDFAPGHIVVPDQLFDNTKKRSSSFFGDGLVAHIDSSDPFCSLLSQNIYNAVSSTGVIVHLGGAFITIEGPRFSSKAESNTFRSWGMSIIGMTTSPEAYLAREAEICYAVMAHVTDYDVWHTSEQPVTVEMVITILNRNTEIAQSAVRTLVANFDTEQDCKHHHALANAIVTDKKMIPPDTRKKVELFVAKYL